MSEHRIPPDDREREPEDPMGEYEDREAAIDSPEGHEKESDESPETLGDDELGGLTTHLRDS
jgi:hypothetical protein